MEGKLETLFERYRSHGDAGALGEVFDRTADELFRLGVHLSRDPVAAEDLLQQTFLAAIERRDQYDASRPLVPWLTGILSNMARRRWRDDARRPDPSRLTWGEPVEGRASLDDVGQEIRSAVEGLNPPYREVVLLNLRFGLKPADIAVLTDREPATIRTQLHRGLEKLRARLPVSLTAGLSPALTGMGTLREVVVAKASVAVGTTATPSLALGGLVLTKKGLGLAALLLGCILCVGAVLLVAQSASESIDEETSLPTTRHAAAKSSTRATSAVRSSAQNPRALEPGASSGARDVPPHSLPVAAAARPDHSAVDTAGQRPSDRPEPPLSAWAPLPQTQSDRTSARPTYLSQRGCKKCHFKQAKSWKKTVHAKAMDPLKTGERTDVKTRSQLDPEKDYTRDASCLPCHATGYGQPGGYPALKEQWSENEQKLARYNAGVGCESCHGPGSQYAPYKKEHEEYQRADVVKLGLVLPVRRAQCGRCHDRGCPTMPPQHRFDFRASRQSEYFHEYLPLKHDHGEIPRSAESGPN